MTEPKPAKPVRAAKRSRTRPDTGPATDGRAKTEQKAPPRRQAVVILGMHRSGTSALAKVFHYLGCTAPKSLIEADENNVSGYWESDVIRVLNDRILDSGGTKWNDWRRFNPNWYRTARYDEFLSVAGEAIAREYGSARLIMMKDPRMCRLAPFWTEALEETGYQPKFIITVRNPLEVCSSLQARDGMPQEAAALLWLRHVLDAEFDTRGQARHFIRYDGLLADWMPAIEGAQESLDIYWPRLSQQVEGSISRFLSADLRHHEFRASDIGRRLTFGPWLSTVFQTLARWSEEGEAPADFGTLDEVRLALNEVPAGFARTVDLLVDASAAVLTKEKELGLLRGEAGKRGDRVKELTEELAAARMANEQHLKTREESARELEQLNEKFAERDAGFVKLQNDLQEQLADRNRALRELETRSTQVQLELKTLHHELEARESALLQRTAEAEETFRELGQLRQQMAELEEEAKAAQLGFAEKASALDSKLASKTAELDALHERLTDHTRRLGIQLEAKEAELVAAIHRLSESESTCATQVDEIVILTKGLIDRDELIAGYQIEVKRLAALANLSVGDKFKQAMARLFGAGGA